MSRLNTPNDIVEEMFEANRKRHDQQISWLDKPCIPKGEKIAEGVYRAPSGMIIVGDKL